MSEMLVSPLSKALDSLRYATCLFYIGMNLREVLQSRVESGGKYVIAAVAKLHNLMLMCCAFTKET